jgi:hypothetical protein
MNFRGELYFHPVGQGLFSSAKVEKKGIDKPLTWVYDCGTVSAGANLPRQIERLRRTFPKPRNKKAKLDVVTISHFDKDHISGISALLGKFSVGVLLLPFLPIWHRTFLAFTQGLLPSDHQFAFFANPVDFLTRLDGSEIDRIIFVPPSDGESPRGEREAPNLESANLEESWSILAETSSPESGDREDFSALSPAQPGPRVEMLRRNGQLTAGGVWTFLPYNDAASAPSSLWASRAKAAALGQELLRGNTEAERAESLKKLKELYDEHFGRNGARRNAISLFLYTGISGHHRPFCSEARLSSRPWRRDHWGHDCPVTEAGMLYTGDGDLHERGRLARLLSFLGPDRIRGLNCVQVMHHGARRNWFRGVGTELAPLFSVFSSDPKNQAFRHPHPDVVADFARFRPVQATLQRSVAIEFEMS